MEDFLGQIETFAFNFAPRGWAACNGQLMPVQSNTALFSLLGTTFGGDGRTTFGLPDLRGRSMVHFGQGPGLQPVVMGEAAGNEQVSILTSNMPAHTHAINAQNVQTKIYVTTTGGGTNEPGQGQGSLGAGGSFPAIFSDSATVGSTDYVAGVTTSITGTTGIQGGSQPLPIRNPYLVMNVCIALQGIFPSRQ